MVTTTWRERAMVAQLMGHHRLESSWVRKLDRVAQVECQQIYHPSCTVSLRHMSPLCLSESLECRIIVNEKAKFIIIMYVW